MHCMCNVLRACSCCSSSLWSHAFCLLLCPAPAHGHCSISCSTMLNATKAWAQQFDNKTCLQQQRLHPGDTLLASAFYTWAAWYNTWLLIKLTAQGVVFSFLFFSVSRFCRRRHKQELSSEAGNPHGFDAAKKCQRASVFCDWLIATFGRYLAHATSHCSLSSNAVLSKEKC
jgi:hypothetical protein